MTTVALRDNQPNADSGRGTLALLSPDPTKGHGRKNSASSLLSAEGTEPDHGAHPASPGALSTTTTMTAVPHTPNEKTKFSQSTKSGTITDDKAEPVDAKLTEIADVAEPAPFAFRPRELAEMAENKSMEELNKMGGPEGLLRGVGTDPTKGLSAHAIGEGPGGGEGPFGASIEDRRRVYGINQMPAQKSKSLLLLMWLALQDKVLVRPIARDS
jgi:P-type Ca2+ transporter type 2C